MQLQPALIIECLLLHASHEPARHPHIGTHGQRWVLHDVLGQPLGFREHLLLWYYAVHNTKLRGFFRREVAACQSYLGGETPPAPEPGGGPVLRPTDAP